MKKHQNSMTITEKRIASSKGLQLICAILSLVLDLAVLSVLIINVSEIIYLICPILIALFDAVFIVKVLCSNYRFAYVIKDVVLHICSMILVCGGAWLITCVLDDRIVFVDFAMYALPAVHLVQCITVIFTTLHAARIGKGVRKFFTAVVAGVFTLGVGVYGVFLFTSGFFGQGGFREYRTVVYSLDEARNCYIATDVLDGRSKAAVIPAEFNGLPVGGIDCNLFANKELTTLRLECGADIIFSNTEKLREANADLQLISPKESMDAFRTVLYALVKEHAEALPLANRVSPADMGENEVYVTFCYTADALAAVDYEILPTWIATKGSVFDIYTYAAGVSYIEHSDALNNADLYWCYKNQQSQIFKMAVNGEEAVDINNTAILESMHATVTFDKVYRLQIMDDNDDKYIIDSVYRVIQSIDGEFPYKLATADHVVDVLNAVPGRNGFLFKWLAGSDRHEMDVQKVSEELALLDYAGKDCLELYPTWELKAPEIISVTADGMRSGHSALYGSNVVLESNAVAPISSVSLRYEWQHGGVVARDSKHTITNLHPDDAGAYTLVVTAYSDTETSLTSTASMSVSVGFQKKELNFNWSLPTDTVYSAQDKPIGATYDITDVINSDSITFNLSSDSVRNAGTHEINLSLSGDCNDKYVIAAADASRSVVISPYRLNITWGEQTSFVYSGAVRYPSATAFGLGDDGVLLLSHDAKSINVGTYTTTVTCSDQNYLLVNNSMTYHITPCPITLNAWSSTILTYNGLEQSAMVTSLSGAVPGEQTTVINSLNYTGRSINVGSHTVQVSLPADSNYMLMGETTKAYRIEPKKLQVSLIDESTVYSGTPLQSFRYSCTGLEGSDTAEQVFRVNYKGSAVGAINVSNEPYVIDADLIPGVKYNNYDISLVKAELEIKQKTLHIYVSNVEKVFDGQVYPYRNFAFTYSELAPTDSINQVLTVSYEGTAINATTPSNTPYIIRAKITEGAKYDNYAVQMHTGALTIRKAPLTVTAVGGSKMYDGIPGSEFSYTVEGLVGGDQVSGLGVPGYGGIATGGKNVGKHTLTVRLPDNSVTSHYDITYVDGVYEITPRPMTVKAVGGSKVYDGQAGGHFSIEVNGLIRTDSMAQLGTPIYGGAAVTDKNVGVHTLSVRLPSGTVADNYAITYVDGNFEITKKEITISAVNGSKVYDGQTGGSFDFAVDGLAGNDTKDILGIPVYSGTATGATDVGSYVLSVFLPGHGNYEIKSYADATYEVSKRALTVTAVAIDRVADGSTGGTFSFTMSGLAEGDTEAEFGEPIYDGTALTAAAAGTYTLTVSFGDTPTSANYEITYVPDADFVITAAP